MLRLVRPLAVTTAVLGTAAVGVQALTPAPAPVAAAEQAPAPRPAAPDRAGWQFAVNPRPLSEAVTRGLKFLADKQNPDGGWSQGGGWRTTGNRSGREEGANVEDPSDVGNTCVTLLAFLRAGHTPQSGEYKDHVAKGLRFVFDKVDKSDAKDLYVTDVRNTQLQHKIGPYVDTFLTTLVLAEVKGSAGDEEKRLAVCLDKVVTKVALHQKADGTFAGNGGWAPVLSQGVANKALARAQQRGAKVSDEVIARVGKQSADSLVAAAPTAAGSGRADSPRGGGGFGGGIGGMDAGVRLYSQSQGAGGSRDAANSANTAKKDAEKVLADPTAKPADKDAARKRIDDADKLERAARESESKLAAAAKEDAFVRGFGSNGGEEFLSFLNISETLVIKGGDGWTNWDGKMQQQMPKAQDKDGGWSGHHCITGRTFCTASALLVLLADRTQFPAEAIQAARAELKPADPKANDAKPDEKK